MEYKPELSPLLESSEYLILLVCMVGIVAALLFWRQKMVGVGGFAKGTFSFMKGDKTEDIKIVAHKPLDVKNRIVVIECEGNRYVILVGVNHSMLIDKISIQNMPHKNFQDFLKDQSAGNEST